MALLGKRKSNDPLAALERELGELNNRRIVLEQKSTEASAAVATATDVRRAAMLDADLDDATTQARRNATVRECAR